MLFCLTGVAALLRFTAIAELPPGIYHDEAYNGLDAWRVLQGYTPLFFQANNGREPVFIYLLSLGVWVWGRSPGALRIVSALIGVCTIPAIYWLGRELFGRRVATLAAALALTSVWTLNLSRVAFRAVAMPPVMILGLALFWRGLRRRRGLFMVGAGLLFGLSLYTYLAARFGVVALLFLILYIRLWHADHCWGRGLLLFLLASFVALAPLGWYFAGHPSSVLGRAGQVSMLSPSLSGGRPVIALMRNVWKTALGFFYRGDFIPRHNIPLRPIFGPVIATTFIAGVGLSFTRMRRAPAYGLILIWLAVMALPTVLAEDAPHLLRGSGMLSVLYYFPALGLGESLAWTHRRGYAWVGALALCAVLLFSSVLNVRDYSRHLGSEAVYYNFEAGATELASDINAFLGTGWQGEGLAAGAGKPATGRQVLLADRLWDDWPSVRYLCEDSESLRLLSEVSPGTLGSGDETKLFVWPYEDNRAALSLLPPRRLVSVDEGAWERGDLEDEARPLYVVFHSRTASNLPDHALAKWEEGIELIDFELTPLPDQQLQIDLFWRTRQPLGESYTVFAHVTRNGAIVGQHDGPAALGFYATNIWRAGDVIQDRHTAKLSIPYEEGGCQVSVGLYRLQTMERLSILDASGEPQERSDLVLP